MLTPHDRRSGPALPPACWSRRGHAPQPIPSLETAKRGVDPLPGACGLMGGLFLAQISRMVPSSPLGWVSSTLAVWRRRSKSARSGAASVSRRRGRDGAHQGLRHRRHPCTDALHRFLRDEEQLAFLQGFGGGRPGAAVGDTEFAECAARLDDRQRQLAGLRPGGTAARQTFANWPENSALPANRLRRRAVISVSRLLGRTRVGTGGPQPGARCMGFALLSIWLLARWLMSGLECSRGDVRAVRCVPGGGRPVLRGLRRSFGGVPVVRRAGDAWQAVLPCLRVGAGRNGVGPAGHAGSRPGCGAGGGAAGVLGFVL